MISWEQAVELLRNSSADGDLVKACYYDDPLIDAAKRFHEGDEWKDVFALLGSHMPGEVLDIGAGRGISSYAFAKSGCKVCSLEPDSSPIVGSGAISQLAGIAKLPIEICSTWGEQMPFDPGRFDIVYGRAVLHHAHELYGFCREASRVLRSGGIFFMTREHVLSKRDDLQKFLDGHPLHKLYGGEAAYTLSEYCDAIKASGLVIKKCFSPRETPINYFPRSSDDMTQELRSLLKRKSMQAISPLLKFSLFRKVVTRQLDRRDQSPGRLYSFLAVKP